MDNKRGNKAEIKKTTHVLFFDKGRQGYIMTNEEGPEWELLRVFVTDTNWNIIIGEDYLLGSIFAHDPYILMDLEKVDCTFEELNPTYFQTNHV